MKLFFAVVLAGCVSSNSATCPDGRLCPAGTVCDSHELCVAPDQLTACNGKQPADECMFAGGSGHCLDGVCLPTTCGDGVVELGEMCDPTDSTPCSGDCTSDLKCGNGVIDVDQGETCDDSNFLDNDGCSSSCQLEQPHWIHHALKPGPRDEVGMTYDFRRGRAVGFGGNLSAQSTAVEADTLEWNGADWELAPVDTLPPARNIAGIAYDAERGQTVMFGGFDGVYSMQDTWLFDGADWHGVDVAGPDPRSGHVLVYDAKRKVTVMYGGYGNEDGDHDDTWEWDGTKWTHIMSASPPAREAAQAAFDPKHGVIVMAGGYNSGTAKYYADTWTYDGAWHDVTPTTGTQPQLTAAAMVWDPTTQKMMLLGGIKVNTQTSSVWSWDGSAWTLSNLALPMGARSSQAAVNAGDRVVVFGGYNQATQTIFDDTWFYANGAWTQPAAIGPRAHTTAFNEPARRDAIVFGGINANGLNSPLAETWAFASTGNTLRANTTPSARSSPCVAWDPARSYGVMFGGATTATPTFVGETWTWSGAGWTQQTPAHPPSARAFAACAFDGKNVTLFGGQDASFGDPLADAYTWDGTDWTAISVPPGLVARKDAAAAYDPVRNVMVLYGGTAATNAAKLTDTWIYDGVHATWSPAADGFKPNERSGESLTWNPARQRLVLAGGLTTNTDSYEWDGTSWHTLAVGAQPPAHQNHEGMSSFDGGGVSIYGGSALLADGWELRWEGARPHDQCDGSDLDGDGLVGCADPDCWSICTPLCMPGVPNCDPATGPTCGDGVCDPSRENARTCPHDCPASAPVCGDGYCDAGETCPGDCP